MGRTFQWLADNRSAGSLASRLRRRRHRLFRALIAMLPLPVSVLDLGGTEEYWVALGREARAGLRVVLLNRKAQPTRLPGFESLAGDAADLARFGDREFDVVFSNSLIEHLGAADRRRMADEVVRVGLHYFIQTPNRGFPIEPHFLVPGFQFLSEGLRVALVRRFALGWYPRIPDAASAREHVRAHHLLSAAELSGLFPAARLHRERLLGLTKSLVAYA